MPTLFYSPGSCSLSPQIALSEAGIPFTLKRVDLRSRKLEDGEDYTHTNPKGYVPALLLDDGQLLTEGVAIVQYVADLAPQKHLAPPATSFERYRLQELLNFITTELHKSISILFGGAPETFKEQTRDRIAKRLELVEQRLEGQLYLLGEVFTVADGYLFWVLRTWKRMSNGRALTPNLSAFLERVEARPAVQSALKAERGAA